jgi:glyceraldehyde 3-phosphate dehydrogenase
MGKIKLAINGFGRIGRSTFRAVWKNPNIEIVAINDLVDASILAHLLKYDSVFPHFSKDIEGKDDCLSIENHKIKIISEKNIQNLPWKELGIDVVIESTGVFRETEKMNMHLEAGAKKVLLSAPPKDDIPKMIVLGVNDHDLLPEDKLISNASCTTNCLAPMIKILDRICGIEKGMATTIHAYTSDQALIDSPHRDLRRARSAAINIVPTTTGAAKAVVNIFEHLKGNLTVNAYRVPVVNGSITDLVCTVKNKRSPEEINHAFYEASKEELKGILEYNTDEIVSTDILGNSHSTVFDSKLTLVDDHMVKIVGWYDNETGYSTRLSELVVKMGENIR